MAKDGTLGELIAEDGELRGFFESITDQAVSIGVMHGKEEMFRQATAEMWRILSAGSQHYEAKPVSKTGSES
jgi:hypothetical protein